MSDRFMLSAFARLNDHFSLTYEVGGSDSAHLVLGQLPNALELDLDYTAMQQLSKVCTAAVAEMRAKYAELHGVELIEEDLELPHAGGEPSA